jgi:hypothetical protein
MTCASRAPCGRRSAPGWPTRRPRRARRARRSLGSEPLAAVMGMIARQAGAGQPGFDAAVLAAIAGRPGSSSARPGQRVVAPFAGDGVRRRSAPGGRPRCRRRSRCRAITPNTTSAPAAAPSVASDRAKQLASLARRISRCSAFQILPQRLADQAGGIGVLDQAADARFGAGHADADAAARLQFAARRRRPGRRWRATVAA